MRSPPTRIEQMLTLALLGMLIGGCFLVLRPFITALLWAGVLCATTWPLFVRIKLWMGDRAALASAAMTLLITLVVVAPFVIVGVTLAENFDRITAFTKGLAEHGPPDPPGWVSRLPLIGEPLRAYWARFAHDTPQLLAEAKTLIDPLKVALVSGGAGLAQFVLQLTLSVLIAYFFYRDGDAATLRLRAAVDRLAPNRGRRLLEVAAGTTRGVVYGILGTALAQGVLMGIGLWIADFGAAPLLGLVTFFLSPVPIGPPLVWIPAAIWLFSHGETGLGIFMLLWGGLVVSMVDNVLKPIIISRGSNLPFLPVMLGILGGVVAFGFIGVFLGPVLLGLGLALLKEWAVLAEEQIESPMRPPVMVRSSAPKVPPSRTGGA